MARPKLARNLHCSVPNCPHPGRISKGYCSTHLARIRKHGSPDIVHKAGGKPKHRKCSIEGCERKHYSSNYCAPHYERLKDSGNVQADVPIRQGVTPEVFWSNVVKTKGCWLWTGSQDRLGYGRLRANGKIILTHRYALFLFHGEMPIGDVLHACDNPSCVNPDHLRVGTHADNMRDRDERNRTAVGERNGKNKYSKEQIREVKQLLRQDFRPSKISKMLNIPFSTISAVKNRRYWRHVSEGGEVSS